MSDDLYRTRLWWSLHLGRGVAQCDGVSIALRERPNVLIDIRQLSELEYTPAIGVAFVQTATGPRRDLHGFEADALADWLLGVAMRARAGL
jgi:hypothetical protein